MKRRASAVLMALTAIGAALGFALAQAKPASYNAEAVLVIPTAVETVNPGAVSEAIRLASTYSKLIPQSVELVHSVAQRVGVPVGTVRRSLGVTGQAGTTLLNVTYTARSATEAVDGGRATGSILTQGITNIPARTLSIIALPSQPGIVHLGRVTAYRETTTLEVSSGAGTIDQGNADSANKVAVTLAGVIPIAPPVLALVARRLGTTPNDVQKRVSATVDTNTALLRLDFRGKSRAGALLGATTVAKVVTTPGLVALPDQAPMLVRLPTTATQTYSASDLTGIGAVIGLILGILLLVIWRRSRPRVSDPAAAEALLSVPATDGARLSESVGGVLVQRWRAIADDADGRGGSRRGHEPRIVLVSVGSGGARAADAAATWFGQLDAGTGALTENGRDRRSSPPQTPSEDHSPRAAAGLQLATVDATDVRRDPGAVVDYEVIVLVSDRGTQARHISAVVDALAEVGRGPDWVLLSPIGVGRGSPESLR